MAFSRSLGSGGLSSSSSFTWSNGRGERFGDLSSRWMSGDVAELGVTVDGRMAGDRELGRGELQLDWEREEKFSLDEEGSARVSMSSSGERRGR